MTDHDVIYATCVKVGSIGVLFLGASGSGKSDLALRLLDQHGRGTGELEITSKLVADDQTLLRCEGKRIIASAPEVLRGLLEVRGLGIVQVSSVAEAPRRPRVAFDLQGASRQDARAQSANNPNSWSSSSRTPF